MLLEKNISYTENDEPLEDVESEKNPNDSSSDFDLNE
jgi:hypothetical protein